MVSQSTDGAPRNGALDSNCRLRCVVGGDVATQAGPHVVGDSIQVEIALRAACPDPVPLNRRPAEVIILFSHSYMMIQGDDSFAQAKSAANMLIDGLNVIDHRVSLVAHTYKTTLIRLLSNDFNSIKVIVESLPPTMHLESPSLYEALSVVDYIVDGDQRKDTDVIIVIIGKGDLESRDSVSLAGRLRLSGYSIYAIGFAKEPHRVELLKRVVGDETHYFSGTSPELVQLAVRGILDGVISAESERWLLEIHEGEMGATIIPGSSRPQATESPGKMMWAPEKITDRNIQRGYDVRALMPGVFPVASAINIVHDGCPGGVGRVSLDVPEVLIVAPTSPPEATPTIGVTSTAPSTTPTVDPEVTPSLSPSASAPVLITRTVTTSPMYDVVYHPLLVTRRR